jgi:hypothetical protein
LVMDVDADVGGIPDEDMTTAADMSMECVETTMEVLSFPVKRGRRKGKSDDGL